MKNGTQSNKLTLIDSAGQTISDAADVIDPSQDYSSASTLEDADAALDRNESALNPALILLTVSLACAAAAIATGSYALWLSRQKAVRRTLTDVQDILRLCQDRMHQMEDDLSQLPQSLSTAS